MAEARCRERYELNPIGIDKQCEQGCDSLSSGSEREEMEDVLAEPGLKRTRTVTVSSICSCSAASGTLWQPPNDPTEINMLDVP